MLDKRYRVIQWASGAVGQVAIRHFVDNPVFNLVGVWVNELGKVGKDAGELAGVQKTGVLATNDVDAILALDADCVHYAPRVAEIEIICRLLRGGKNVVSPSCGYYPTDVFKADVDQIKAACTEGHVSFHGSGIHPGFAGDILPLNYARLMSRIDCIHVYEIVDYSSDDSWSAHLGFGGDPDEVLANPRRGAAVVQIFAQSMAMLVEGLGKTIERVATNFEVAKATRDVNVKIGLIPQGSVAGMHFEWTAWVEGKPLVVFHQYWTMGQDVEPNWGFQGHSYRLVFEGDPPLQVDFRAPKPHPSGDLGQWGLAWTAMNGVNAIPDVCDANPGMITHLELGLLRPRGLIR